MLYTSTTIGNRVVTINPSEKLIMFLSVSMAILINSLDQSNPLHLHANDSNDVYLGHVFSNNDVVVWKELQETYDRVDGSIVFNLLQKINSFKQGGLRISEYYLKLHSLWREFDILTKLPDCACEARPELEILLEVKDAFVILAREESYIKIYPTFAKIDEPQASAFFLRLMIIEGIMVTGTMVLKLMSLLNDKSGSTAHANMVAYSFLAQPTTSPQLENEDFQQMDGNDLEELEKKGYFARECRSGRNQVRRSYGDNGRSNAPTNESLSQALVAQYGLGGYDWSNDFELEPVNYDLMAISSSSSSSSSDSEVQKCSKQCLDTFKTIQKNYDTEREKHNKAKLEIKGYELALESLESRILVHEKNELAWGEKYEFQNYELKCREIKINNLNLELEKVVKERDELKDKIAKWEESSKNLDEILNSQMSARDKTGLGYSTQLNELSSNHETDSENSLSIFYVRSSDEEIIPENDRSSKNRYKAVPPPITRNFLTPRADISFAGLDEYAIRNKIIDSQITELNTKTSETTGKPKSASESVVSNPKIDRDRVIIEDWNSDDEEEVSEVQTVRPETQTVKTRDDKSDCNFHDKKSQESKLKNVVNTGQMEGKPVWDNAKRINHQIFSKYPHLSKTFVPSGVLTRTGLHRPSDSTARPVCTARPSVSTARPVCTARPSVSTAKPNVSCSIMIS
ncbi:hypothetical protein Tco_1173043 [Tanacetum coccineum]